jgi:hypothetical protein
VASADRAARTRRIARLLVALGESPTEAIPAARRLASRVLDGPRGEQLAIIEHRERVAGGGDRSREAWVLRRVLGWGERDAARALDCSRTALRLHLGSRPPLDPDAEAASIEEIRRRMDEVRVTEFAAASFRHSTGGRALFRVAMVSLTLLALAIATRFVG